MADFDVLARQLTPEQLAEAIGAERSQGGWRCPMKANHANGDKDRSFTISRVGRRLLANCMSSNCGLGGTPVQVCAEVWGVSEPVAGSRLAKMFRMDEGVGRRRQEIAETYPYTDEGGDLLYEVVRYRPKAFRQRRPDGNGGWCWSLGDARRVLYRLPAVLEAVQAGDPVHLVEGEKDVHALEEVGGVATTAPGGAGKWREEYSETLRGAQVVIVADRDDGGRAHAWKVAAELEDVAASVRVVESAVGKDAHDHLAAGYGLDDFAAATAPVVEVPYPLLLDRRLSPTHLAVYAAIAASTSFGPVRAEDLAAMIGCHANTVYRARKKLRSAGWIKWQRRGRRPCRYKLRQSVSAPRVSRSVPSPRKTPSTHATVHDGVHNSGEEKAHESPTAVNQVSHLDETGDELGADTGRCPDCGHLDWSGHRCTPRTPS